MSSKVQTPKGFRDFLPQESSLRAFVLEKLRTSFEKFGFEPLETSAIEFAETLKGKYGEEEKLIYEFTDRGGRQIALRYDQTVPLARVVSQYPTLPNPFKRYQVQPVWRAENPQKGRFREFIQVDFDTVGAENCLADAEIVATAIFSMKELGFKDFTIRVNDRNVFDGLSPETIRALDKLQKIGETGVIEQIKREGYDTAQAKALFKRVRNSSPTKRVTELFDLLENFNIEKDKYAFDPSLARGLDYYTGLIFELEVEGYSGGSIGGGGRYDDLIGRFAERKIPAVGFSFGFDRLIEAANEAKLLPTPSSVTKVLVSVFNEDLLPESLALATRLRNRGINTEVPIETDSKLDRQLKYADIRNIPFVIILGPEEVKSETLTFKNLATGQQETLKENEVSRRLTSK